MTELGRPRREERAEQTQSQDDGATPRGWRYHSEGEGPRRSRADDERLLVIDAQARVESVHPELVDRGVGRHRRVLQELSGNARVGVDDDDRSALDGSNCPHAARAATYAA